MPFLRQHLKDTAYIPERSRSNNTSYHTVGRHKNHAACSTTNYELPTHKIIYGTGLQMSALVQRLGDGRFRFQKVSKQIARLTPRDQEQIKSRCLQQLSGRSRTIALYRLQHCNDQCRISLEIKMPQVGIYQSTLRWKMLRLLKEIMNGPVMLTLKTVSAPRIVDCMTNHRKWNERLGEQLPCTCETLERRFGFTRSECGHVCEKFKELPFCNMSVKSRVMPTKDYLQKLFDKHLSAFYFRNKDKFRVPLAVLIDNSRRWTDEYGNFLIFSNQCGYPNQVKYQNFKERWDDYLVITRFIDKEQVSNSVSCPALYQQRAAKCWKNNPAFTILSEADYLARRQKLFDQIIKLKISGLSRSPCKSFH